MMSVPKKEALHRPASNANTYEKLKREGGREERGVEMDGARITRRRGGGGWVGEGRGAGGAEEGGGMHKEEFK